MATPTTSQQIQDEDDAARLRHEGRSWSLVAQALGVTTATAKLMAAASDQRATDRAQEHQIALF
ncbi:MULTISPECIES: hypothetical protein [Gordonia]|jgi:hypothetical protein|uniref:Uncharacterized protein n=1 Tax=Gordonia sihwensis NBRC 108236 TaxID=1223544 RepID=L7LNL4_9ACTN|nr:MULTISPECIES: hypothetical protein [Gordonia]AUH70539.1 hypothetical protein CXX93_19145 [Gordonia sp. YC-JH1]KJR00981.1 hypothetical protein UG54_19515 [Gordonia sihwensis]WFN95104.1 hypothetical protein P5P27_20230 [Gordonia sihwensis]GAC62321.1 hypothetical protein GSI01S_33_00070 [Gordonia sihwensis NBRC 108236]